jgi:type I restriction enzyme S subunit
MIEKNNVPKHWEIKKLGEVADYINGRAFKPTEWEKTGKPIIRIQNLNKAEAGYNYSNQIFEDKYLIDKGDLLYAWSASLGAYLWNGDEAWLNQHIFKVIPKDICNKKYLFYTLEKITSEIYAKTHGSGMVHVTKGKFEETEIPFPSLSEQQTIVSKIEELLSDLENGKQQLQTALQQLKIYRQSLLKYAFEGKLTNKNVNSGELPIGWKWAKLGDVCYNVEYGSASKSEKVGKVPVLRMGNIQNGMFDWDDLVFTNNEEEIEKYLLKKNDVLFNRTNSAELVGKTAIYKGERPAIFAGYLIRINRIESVIDSKYLTYFLNSQFAKNYGNSVRSFGVNQSNINGTKLKTYPLPLCPLEEQQLIVNELESKLAVCDKFEETITQSLLQAETLKQSILKKAFEGKLI